MNKCWGKNPKNNLPIPDGKKVEYDYNLANQLISVTDWLGNKTEYQYDKHGRLSKQIYPNGVVLTREYDKGGRLTSQKETIGSTRIIRSIDMSMIRQEIL